MPARLTAYVPDRPAALALLRQGDLVRIGRGDACDLRLDHPSVSRAHCEIAWLEGNWRLRDPGSKNGSFVDGIRAAEAVLGEHAWLRLGDVHCEFSTLTQEAADAAGQRLAVRRENSRLLIEGLAHQTALPGLLQETVRAAVELVECERGFLLLDRRGTLEVVASHGLDRDALLSRRFGGSASAVQRALATRAPLVVNDASLDGELAAQASVLAGGLRTLVCLPLSWGGDPLGMLYADSRQVGAVITSMDLELLAAFAERAALWIAARRGIEAIDGLEAPLGLDWAQVIGAQGIRA